MKKKKEDLESEDLLKYMKLSSKKKLLFLEKLNEFLDKAMPAKSKKIWLKLKSSGW